MLGIKFNVRGCSSKQVSSAPLYFVDYYFNVALIELDSERQSSIWMGLINAIGLMYATDNRCYSID